MSKKQGMSYIASTYGVGSPGRGNARGGDGIHACDTAPTAPADPADLNSAIIDTTASLIIVLDPRGRIVSFNKACERASGYTFAEAAARANYEFLLDATEVEKVRTAFNRINAGEFPSAHENDWIARDGTRRHIVWSTSAVVDERGEVRLIVGCGNDITERRQIELKLRESEERYALAVRGANDGIWDWDLRADTLHTSDRWKAMLGANDEEIGTVPDDWFSRIHPEDLPRFRAALDQHIEGKSPHVEIEHRMRHRSGLWRWYLVRGLAIRDAAGKAYRVAGSLTDVNDRKAVEDQLVREALYDSLTGLGNRVLIQNRLQHALARARRNEDFKFAVLFLDLDRFKIINDGLGHLVGDQLLVELSKRLRTCVRPADTVARLGGDEFIILLEDLREEGDAVRVAERVHELLKTPFALGENEIFSSASIGIAPGSPRYRNVQDLLRDADAAMYRAKALGKSRHEIFDEALHEKAMETLQLETDLRHAVERGEFFPAFQPIVSLIDGSLQGFEALVRWRHPDRGMVSPATFIPVMEETGLIVPLGAWMLRVSCLTLARWRQRFPALAHVGISINVSGKQFARGDLAGDVAAALAESGLPPDCLTLEITESVMMSNSEQAAQTLRRLREHGVSIHVDDFGVGYSSLAQLHRFPIDALKIDRAFVSRIAKTIDAKDEVARDSSLVRTIISLARNLGLGVTAEGIETAEQLEYLRQLRCELGQGYLFSKPLAEKEMEALLAGGLPWGMASRKAG